MSWDKAKELSEKEGSGIFIKLKDGQSIEGVFRGDPFVFFSIFKDPKEYNEKVKGAMLKFKINFFVKENNEWQRKIFQQGNTFLKDLIEFKDEYGLDHVFKIKRKGSTKDDTKYHILPKGPISKEDLEIVNKLGLLPLRREDYDIDDKSPKSKDLPEPDNQMPPIELYSESEISDPLADDDDMPF